MGDLLTIGAQWLGAQLKAHAAHEITYVRGVQRLGPLSATIGSTEFEIQDFGGVRVEHSDRDFIVTASDLVFDGQVTAPVRSDQILDPDGPNGEVSTYEVMAPGDAQPYRLDSTGTMLRIHAKKVAVA
jgi:hypothetical protein